MKKVILSTLSILGVFTTFAVTPPLTSHAYNISLSDRACDSMRGKVDIPQTELPGLSSQTEQILLAHNKGGKLGSQPPKSYVTKLLVQNPNQPSVTTWVTLPTTSSLGGPTDVSQLRIVDQQGAPVTITPSTGSQGAFTLPTGGIFTVGSTISGNIFDGILFTFNALPQCPCSAPNCSGGTSVNLPNGTNFAEATLNPPTVGQVETVDISCVNGSPLPKTGMETASLTLPMKSQSAVPV